MASEIEIMSPLSPAEVTERLRARGREWREPLLPPAVREAGFTGVRVRIAGDRFSVQFKSGPRSPYCPRCDGRVKRAATGSRLTARIRPTTGTIASVAVLLLWISLLGGLGHSAEFWLTSVGIFGGVYAWSFALSAPWRAGLLDVVRAAASSDAGAPSRSSIDAGAV